MKLQEKKKQQQQQNSTHTNWALSWHYNQEDWFLLEIYVSDLSGGLDQFAILGNFSPSPYLTQQFS